MRKTYLLIGFIFVFLISMNYVNASVSNSLKLYYSFDYYNVTSNNPIDIATLMYNGTGTSGLRNSSGLLNNSFNFSNQGYVNTGLNINEAQSFSINIWFKKSSFSGTQQRILSTYGAGQTESFLIDIMDTGAVRFYKEISSSFTYKETSTGYNNNVWHMATFIYNGSGGEQYYIDGVNFANDTGNLSTSNTQNMYLGDATTGQPTANAYTGLLDEFGIWNNTILTSNEITQLYNSGSGLSYYNFVPTSITISSVTPINYTYTYNNNSVFTFNVTSIIGTWNTTLWLNNSNSYGSNNSISSTGVYQINSSTLPSGEYLWWINATSGSLSQITEKRNIFINPGTSTASCVQTLTNAYFIPDGCIRT